MTIRLAHLTAGMLLTAFSFSSAQARELADCPDKPNCVSSLATDEARRIEPLSYRGTVAEAMQTLLSILRSDESVWVVDGDAGWLHVTYTSSWFEFVDDVEFLFDHQIGVIHVRSASRTGYWDFAANRRRVERLREQLAATD